MSASTNISYQKLEDRSRITNLILRWFLYFVLVLFAFYFIFPLYVMLVTSFKTMEEIRQGGSGINPYAKTSKVEFFAVVSEYFFERPELLKRKHPELYELLEKVFKTK